MFSWGNLLSKVKPLLLDRRVLGGLVGAILLVDSIVLMAGQETAIKGTEPAAFPSIGPADAPPQEVPSPVASSSPGTNRRGSSRSTGSRTNVGVPVPKKGTRPPGIDYAKQEIKIVYYWSDSSNSSFLPAGTPRDAVDDGKAFQALVQFINDHADGSANYMGTRLNLGNWRIVPDIVELNERDASSIEAGTRNIIAKQPFAAITARGSVAVTNCPQIAEAGIHVFATNQPYVDDLEKETGGYCISNAISWAQQIPATVNYMRWHKNTTFSSADRPGLGQSCPTGCARVYGFVYSEYKGLKAQAEKVVAKLRAAGVNIPEDAFVSLPQGLSASAPYVPGNRDKLRNAGVNTVIMPDGGTSLSFTHGAGDWRPDYYIWPCSGQDATGYTRLLPPAQWDNASGLSCYHPTFDADLTIDSDDRTTEWYKAYKEIQENGEAPSSTYLIYAALQPIVEAIGRLGGRDFTVENFRGALSEFQSYRYNGVTGRSTAAGDLMLMMGTGMDNSLWGDLARVEWSPAAENPFRYLDPHRYKSNQSFP